MSWLANCLFTSSKPCVERAITFQQATSFHGSNESGLNQAGDLQVALESSVLFSFSVATKAISGRFSLYAGGLPFVQSLHIRYIPARLGTNVRQVLWPYTHVDLKGKVTWNILPEVKNLIEKPDDAVACSFSCMHQPALPGGLIGGPACGHRKLLAYSSCSSTSNRMVDGFLPYSRSTACPKPFCLV